MIETAETTQMSLAASSLLFTEPELEIDNNAMSPIEGFQRARARIAFDNE